MVLRMSNQEDFGRPEKPLEKTREIDNEARISKKAEMKRKFNRNQKRITLRDIQLSSVIFLVRICPHTYTRTQESLPHLWAAVRVTKDNEPFL